MILGAVGTESLNNFIFFMFFITKNVILLKYLMEIGFGVDDGNEYLPLNIIFTHHQSYFALRFALLVSFSAISEGSSHHKSSTPVVSFILVATKARRNCSNFLRSVGNA